VTACIYIKTIFQLFSRTY